MKGRGGVREGDAYVAKEVFRHLSALVGRQKGAGGEGGEGGKRVMNLPVPIHRHLQI